MESERGIIIVGHCRSGKHEMIRQALKGRAVLIGADFGDMASAIASLKMASSDAAISIKHAIDSINELKKITPDKIPSFRDQYFMDEALKLKSVYGSENTIVYEIPQSKFISRPRNNFRKR